MSNNIKTVATTEVVEQKITEIIGAAPEALNTLDELAAALNDDKNFAATVTNKITVLDTKITNHPIKKGTGANNALISVNTTKPNIAWGEASVALGEGNEATKKCAVATGRLTKATGEISHSEGYHTEANGKYSHAEGNNSEAHGADSHAEGKNTMAIGEQSHAEGYSSNLIQGLESYDTSEIINSPDRFLVAHGSYSHAEGANTRAIGTASHAEGMYTKAIGSQAHAEGLYTEAIGDYSHAEGKGTKAYGEYSHAEGQQTKTEHYNAHAEGFYTIAHGANTHVEGANSEAWGENAHAEGNTTKAYGSHSHTEGVYTQTGMEGEEDPNLSTVGIGAHAEGLGTVAYSNFQHTQGRYNEIDSEGKYAHIVGNGTKDERKNIHTLDWNGNAWFAGDVTVGSDKLAKMPKGPVSKLKGTVVTGTSSVDEYGNPCYTGFLPRQFVGAGESLVIYLTKAGGTNKWHFVVDYLGGSGMAYPVPLPYEDATPENTPFYFFESDYYGAEIPENKDFINSTNQEIVDFLNSQKYGKFFELSEEQIKDLGNIMNYISTEDYVDNSLKDYLKKDELEIKTIEQGNDIEFGQELATAEGWTTEGWTGDFNTGFTHTVGEGTPLIFNNLPATGTNLYKVEFDVTDTSDTWSSVAFTVTLGNSDRFITYKGGGNFHYCYGIKSVSDGDFRILLAGGSDPFTDTDTSFKGTIKNISIKKVLNSKTTTNVWYDNDGNASVEAIIDKANKYNTYIGKDSGKNDFAGDRNTAIGQKAMATNTSGFWNTAVGVEALGKNTVGSRNVALGYLALRDNTTGDRNYAIGTFALAANTCGRRNIAIGADALWANTSGNSNIAIGSASMAELTSGSENVAIGQASAQYTKANGSVAIGYLAMGSATYSYRDVAIGTQALYQNEEGAQNTAIGYASLANNRTGKANTAIGSGALGTGTDNRNSIGIGQNAGYKCSDEGAIFIGTFAGNNATGQNMCIGYNAGSELTTGVGNLLIGRRVQASAATASNEMNIGNLLFGNMNTGKVGINKKTDLKGRLNVGAGNETTPQMVLYEGALSTTPVAGAVEYNGDGLYFTDKNASRSKLATTEGCVNEVMQALIDKTEIVEFEKTVEGSTITINNISDTEHNIKCSISGSENLDGVNVIKVGKNLCPNNWEMGYITSQGEEQTSTTYVRTNDYFVLDKSKKYYISAVDVDTNPTVTWYFYDENKTFINKLQFQIMQRIVNFQ